MRAVGLARDLLAPRDLVDRPVQMGVVGPEALDVTDAGGVQDLGGVADGVGVGVPGLQVHDGVRQRRELRRLVAQIRLPDLDRARLLDAARRADPVELDQVDGGAVGGCARHRVDSLAEQRLRGQEHLRRRAVVGRRLMQEVRGQDRDRARIGLHVVAEDLDRLAVDALGAAALGEHAEPVGSGLGRDLRQHPDLVSQRGVVRQQGGQMPRAQFGLELRPGEGVREVVRVDAEELGDRARRGSVCGTVDEEARAVQGVRAGRSRQRQRVGRVARPRVWIAAHVGRRGLLRAPLVTDGARRGGGQHDRCDRRQRDPRTQSPSDQETS